MDITKKTAGSGVAVLEIKGRILMGPDCKLIDQEVERLLSSEQKKIILDLAGVSQIDSAGVGQVVKCYTRLKQSGGELRLAGVRGMLDGVFKMTQVHRVIGIFPDVQAASENF